MPKNTKIIVALLLENGKILKADLMDGTIVSDNEIYNDLWINGITYKVFVDGVEHILGIDKDTRKPIEPPIEELEKINTLI